MFNTLRGRLITSHLIPLFITVPIMGIALIYVLGNQQVLDETSQQLRHQAVLVADLAGNEPGLWHDEAQARRFADRYSALLNVQITLLNSDGHVLATSDIGSDSVGNTFSGIGIAANNITVDSRGTAGAIGLSPTIQTSYNQLRHTEVAVIVIPVTGTDQHVMGAVRLTDEMASAFAPFQRLRTVTIGILLAGFALSIAIGWILALDLERPLNHVTHAVRGLADGQPLEPLPVGRVLELDQLVQAFNTLGERLRVSEEKRSRLLASIIHELGRPLGALHSAVQALLNGADQDPSFRGELLSGMDEELQRLHRLLLDLTQLDRLSSQAMELHYRPLKLSDWLLTIMAPRRELAHEKQITWKVEIPGDLPTIEADADRLGQAFGNLLHNAICYTPVGGTITISAGTKNGQIWVRVSDTGAGMTLEEQGHVFDPFYRGRAVRHKINGMGLGLAIAHDVVAAHGGMLNLESSPGQGSSFTFWLPISTSICSQQPVRSSFPLSST